MKMPSEQDWRELIAKYQEAIDWSIRRVRTNQRIQQWSGIVNAVVFLAGAADDFYRLKYGWGIGRTVAVMLIITFQWRLVDGSIKRLRASKREWAAIKLNCEKILREYLKYKERGFE